MANHIRHGKDKRGDALRDPSGRPNGHWMPERVRKRRTGPGETEGQGSVQLHRSAIIAVPNRTGLYGGLLKAEALRVG